MAAPTSPSDDTLAALREQATKAWSAGHYPTIAERLQPASYELAEVAQVWSGDQVLDIGCGSGNTSVALAQRGGTVTGIDLTDAWFPDAHALAKTSGVEVDLRMGDAEALPFEDASFDVVASCFAHMFAPRHDVVAAEMARVLRPGGVLAVAVWDQQGEPTFEVLDRWLPTKPEGIGSPRQWGDPDYLRARFGPVGVKITRVDLHDLYWEFEDRDAMVAWLFEASGPWIAMRDALREAGVWERAERELLASIDEHDVREDGTCLHRVRYRVAVGARVG